MAVELPKMDLNTLSPIQKMELADVLYDTAQQELDALVAPMTPEQVREVDLRIAAADGGAYTAIPWEILFERLQRTL